MNLVSLCSGYGGLDLAVEEMFGARTVAFSEIEDAPSAVFQRHWPDARPLGDLTAVDWETVEADVVCAGFPCQDLSYAGKGVGITKDSRSGLWYAIEYALGVLRPRYVVLENVSAIVARRPGLDVVLAGLAGLGMSAQWVCVRASDVGAPHRRERWFLVAHAEDVGRGEGRRPGAVPGLEEPGRSPVEPRGRSDALPADAPELGRSEGWTEPDGRRATAGRARPVADAEGDEQRQPSVARPLRAEPWDGAAWGGYAPAINRWEAILGRSAPAPTDDRGRLSPPFVEWMMGLPQGWVTDTPGLSRSKQLKCLGNGVVPQQAAYALAQLLDRERSEVAA